MLYSAVDIEQLSLKLKDSSESKRSKDADY
jgi:hypothetical protein